jgi:hypothetical protein
VVWIGQDLVGQSREQGPASKAVAELKERLDFASNKFANWSRVGA